MKHIIEKNENQFYEIDFSIKYFEKLSKKDQEKVYKILRILSSLGNDKILEETDKNYRFFTDNDESSVLEIINDVVIKDQDLAKKGKKLSVT